jgi:energy-coupling factor transporter ATP-binding protein EcfA2
VLNYLRIRTDYGKVRQIFPINEALNVNTKKIIDDIISSFSDSNLVMLMGEPGSGKSWAVVNLNRVLESNGEKVVKYYCYTSLEDEILKDRIKTNTFYGSLLAEILKIFPDLKNYKELKYASNLRELNLILDKIDVDIYLIIDGLDHINRIYERYRNELTENEVDILNKISKLKFNNRIKCLLVSQPIKELDCLNEFKKYEISNWNQMEIIEYLSKNNIPDVEINKNSLSVHLLEKSEGNPLYLTYIVEELKNLRTIQEKDITNLPSYSFNLQNYYNYLLSKSELSQDVPRILAGASFRLKKVEIKEITKMGDIVDSSLEILSPILKSNYVKHGYTIYHESFRRYVIDYLKQSNISIIEKVYNPLIEWLEEKGFYSNYKSYRYYLPLLLECDCTKKILNNLTYDFLVRSVANGYSWQLIKNNYRYLLYACVEERNIPAIILLNELKHTLISTEYEFDESFENYFEALGYLRGFDQAVNYLSFEDQVTLSLDLGIKACYVCDIHGVTPPWDLYWKYFENKDGVSLEDFKIIVRYNFINDTNHLIRIVKDLIEENRDDYLEEFKDEFEKYRENEIKEELIKNELINNLFNKKKITDSKIEELTTRIIEIDFFSENEINLIREFFICVEDIIQRDEKEILNYLFEELRQRNWFYNWIIYYIKILQIKYNPQNSFTGLKEAFQYLIYDTDPFKGKPRTCDLYKAEGFIHQSLVEGLLYLKNKEHWDEILDILLALSEKTTTSLQKTMDGPLSTKDFLTLLEAIVRPNNIDKIISLSEKVIEKEKDYNLYSYNAEYNFRLSKLYSKVDDKVSAELCFINGTKYLLSYTFRKDTTIEELIESIEGINSLDKDLGDEYIKKIKILTETVINHTDGKGTRHFPITWFSKYLEIDFSNSLLFLFNSLSKTRFHWRLEECLVALLNKSRGSINPLLELFLTKTLPIENSEEFLSTSIKLTEKIEKVAPLLARNSYGQILTKFEIERHSSDKKDEGIYEQLKLKLKNYAVEINKVEKNSKETQSKDSLSYGNPQKTLIEIVNELIKPNPISDLDTDDLTIFLEQNEITDGIINSLIYYFETKTELTDELKGIIRALALKDKWHRGRLNSRLGIIFSSNSTFYHYFLICSLHLR